MKRFLLYIAAIACCYSCTKEEFQTVDILLHGYMGDDLSYQEQVSRGVKCVVINKYSAVEKFGKQEKQLERSIVANYDKEGKIINLNYDNNDYSEYEYICYDNGKIKRIVKNTLDSARTEITYKFVKEFDEDGNLIKEIGYNKNGIPDSPIRVHQYDKKRLIETTYLIDRTWDGKYKKEIHKTNYMYNDKGWLIEEKSYDNESIYEMYTHKYDKKGNRIETFVYDEDGEIDSKIVYELRDGGDTFIRTDYDGDGNMTSKSETTPDEYIIYDNDRNVVDRGIIEDKRLVERTSGNNIWRIEYDKKGHCVKVARYHSYQGKETIQAITECEYTYY